MTLPQLTTYKRKIIKAMYNNQNIVDLILGQLHSIIPNSNLVHKNIFDYSFVPSPTDTASTYVTIDGRVMGNKMGTVNYTTYLIINVMVQKQNMQIIEDQDEIRGNRMDELVDNILALMGDKFGLGVGTNYLKEVSECNSVNETYVYKSIVYDVQSFNPHRDV